MNFGRSGAEAIRVVPHTVANLMPGIEGRMNRKPLFEKVMTTMSGREARPKEGPRGLVAADRARMNDLPSNMDDARSAIGT